MTYSYENVTSKAHHAVSDVSDKLLSEVRKEVGKELGPLTGSAGKSGEANLNKLAGALSFLPDGTYHPAQLAKDFEDLTGTKLDAKTEALVNQFSSITRDGNHFDITSTKGESFGINKQEGPLNIQSLQLGKNISFDLDHDHGNPEFANIKGLTLNANGLGQNLDSNITSLTFGKEGGKQLLTAEVQNPLPGALQAPLGEPGHIAVQIKFGADGKPFIANQSQIQQKLIGGNPLVSSAITTGQDTSNFFSNPTPGRALTVAGDLGYTAFVAPAQTLVNVGGNILSDANPLNW